MKPAGCIDFALDPDLLVGLRDDIEDGELQVSFEEFSFPFRKENKQTRKKKNLKTKQ